jgi:hypothetical protein
MKPFALMLFSLLLAACSGNELVGIHVTFQKDGSGTVTTRALVQPATGDRAETRAAGITWASRAAVVASQGTFASLASVTLGDGDVRFVPQIDGERPGLRVLVKRGPNASWVTALVPEQAQRRAMAKVYDPTGRTPEIGDVLRLEVQVPGEILTSGVLPTGRGVEAGSEGKRAYLLLPVAQALSAGDEFVWEIGWLRRD